MATANNELNFDRKKAISFGFGVTSFLLVWSIYNQFVPVFLQAGNPQFQSSDSSLSNIIGFGLSSTVAFFIMTWDNIINVFFQSWVGAKSDSTWTRWGRRKPWIMAGVPLAAISFVLIPYARTLITIIIFILMTNIGMALFRAPTAALLGDLFPTAQRSTARAVGAIMGGLGAALTIIVGSFLFEQIGRAAPFVLAAVLMLACASVVLIFIQEGRPDKIEAATATNSTVRQALRNLWQTNNHGGIWLLVAIGLSFMIFDTLLGGISSFAVFVLDIPIGEAVRFSAIFALVFTLSAYPSGLIGTRFGRRQTINAGLVGALLTASGGYFFVHTLISLALFLALLGFFMALVLVNDLPLLYDLGNQSQIGAYTGVYFVATQTAAVLGPTMAGVVIDLVGSHRMIFAFAALCALLGWLLLRYVQIDENLINSVHSTNSPTANF